MGFFKGLFNAEHGLVRANVQAYCRTRLGGSGHEDALTNMVATRYRVGSPSPSVAAKLAEVVGGGSSGSVEGDLRALVVEIYNAEVPAKHVNYRSLEKELDDAIAEWSARHPELW